MYKKWLARILTTISAQRGKRKQNLCSKIQKDNAGLEKICGCRSGISEKKKKNAEGVSSQLLIQKEQMTTTYDRGQMKTKKLLNKVKQFKLEMCWLFFGPGAQHAEQHSLHGDPCIMTIKFLQNVIVFGCVFCEGYMMLHYIFENKFRFNSDDYMKLLLLLWSTECRFMYDFMKSYMQSSSVGE